MTPAGSVAPDWRRWVFPPAEGPADAPPLRRAAWERTVLVMHGAFVLLVGLAGVAAVTAPAEASFRTPWALGALGVLGVAYLVAGASGLIDGRPGRVVAYLVVMVLALPVIAWAHPGDLFLLFLVYTQIWMLVEDWRPGVTWNLVLATSTTVGLLLSRPGGGGVPAAVSSMAIGLGFSLFMGLFVATVLRQSQQRAELIATLEGARAELAAVHHEAGVAAERERLAREVHDTLAQGYTSIVVLAQTARVDLAAGRSGAAAERLAVVEEVARENLREARAVVAAFSPPVLDGAGLVAALQRLGDRHTRETGLAVAVDVSGFAATPPTLRRDREIVLLRAAQEALANVRRHAAASAATVALCLDGGVVELRVDDDGCGFDPAASGIGLSGLAHRVREAGGVSEVTSTPGRGSRVAVRVPVG